MAERGCKGSAIFKTLQTDILEVNTIRSNHIAVSTGHYDNHVLTAITDTQADAGGFTAIANSHHELEWDGGNAGAIQLPNGAKEMDHVTLHFTAEASGGANLVITTGTDINGEPTWFMDQTMYLFNTNNVGEKTIMDRVIGVKDSNGARGDKKSTFIYETHNTLTISATGTNNQTNVGAELSFIYWNGGVFGKGWQIIFMGSELGTGAMNATFAGGP